MDATAKKLLSLLESGDIDLRISAIRVITEIGVSSKPIIKALGRCLREPHESVQLVALKGLAKLGAGDVSNLVVPLILSSGVVRDHAMVVITAIGPAVAPQLQKLYDNADFNGKRAVITALSSIGSRQGLEFLLKRLADAPFEIAQHIAQRFCEALTEMKPAEQTAIYPAVQRLLRGKPDPRNLNVHLTGLILMGYFRAPKPLKQAYKALKNFCEKKHFPEIRRLALISFNRLIPDVRQTPEDHRFIAKLLCDEDWENVAQHALNAFRRMEIPARTLPKLVDLLKKSPHFSVHIHVFDRLKGSNRSEIAAAISPFLADPRFRVREAAENALRQVPSGIDHLFRVLVESDDLDVTQRVNSILQEYPQETRRKYLERAVSRLLALFERNDPHHASFLEFIRGVDPGPLRKKIYQKARKLKTSRTRDKWEQISRYLQLLWENHLITADGRYLFAVALIRQSAKNLDPSSRRADLGLRVIRALVYDSCADLTKKVKADKELKQEDYFYLGFHFCEEGEQMGDFGEAMLAFVVKKFPRSKLAAQAQKKLELHRALKEEEAAKASRRAGRRGRRGARASRQTLSSGAAQAARRARPAAAAAEDAGSAKKSAEPKAAASKKAAGKKGAAKKTAGKKGAAKKSTAKSCASKRNRCQRGTCSAWRSLGLTSLRR